MSYVSLLLGKRARERVSPTPSRRPVAQWEGNVLTSERFVTRYADAKIFSSHTERDETQAVGKLYEGRVDG